MISFLNNVKPFSQNSYCFNVEYIDIPSGGSVVKMYSPILMSGMSHGPSSSSVNFGGGKCFCNSSKCKPMVASSVTSQSFIPFACQYNSSFMHLDDGTGHIPKNTKFQCTLINGIPSIRTFSTNL